MCECINCFSTMARKTSEITKKGRKTTSHNDKSKSLIWADEFNMKLGMSLQRQYMWEKTIVLIITQPWFHSSNYLRKFRVNILCLLNFFSFFHFLSLWAQSKSLNTCGLIMHCRKQQVKSLWSHYNKPNPKTFYEGQVESKSESKFKTWHRNAFSLGFACRSFTYNFSSCKDALV